MIKVFYLETVGVPVAIRFGVEALISKVGILEVFSMMAYTKLKHCTDLLG